jgi:hypothetical protein
MAQPAAPSVQTGQLQDPAPDFFTEEHTKSETFKRQFNLYKGLNANFSNVTQKQQAISTLYHLHMQKDCFNDYVAAFKHYAK